MKPNVKVLLEEAKKPQPPYIPARAGWNGPEEKSATDTPNPTYDQLRYEPTPAQLRQQLLAAATPDWRVCLFLAGVIFTWRMAASNGRKAVPSASPVLAFRSNVASATPASEAA